MKLAETCFCQDGLNHGRQTLTIAAAAAGDGG